MRPVLMMPDGHTPDWSAAERYVEALSNETLGAFSEEASAILGQRRCLDQATIRQRLRDGLCELRVAMQEEGSSAREDRRFSPMWRTIRETAVLFEPHPFGRPTYLYCFIRLLDHAGVLDVLGCESLCEIDRAAASSPEGVV